VVSSSPSADSNPSADSPESDELADWFDPSSAVADSPVSNSSSSPPLGENESTPAPLASLDDTPLALDPSVIEAHDSRSLAAGKLTPRHRRFCQLAAAGWTNAQICKELGYVSSRVSVLLKNQFIAAEIIRLQNKLFEETVVQRMKALGDPALSVIEDILTDTSNRVKVSEKLDAAKWVVEKLDGKAIQRHDVGENLLSVLMDRLDAQKTPHRAPQLSSPADIEMRAVNDATPPKPKSEEELLDEWVSNFSST